MDNKMKKQLQLWKTDEKTIKKKQQNYRWIENCYMFITLWEIRGCFLRKTSRNPQGEGQEVRSPTCEM